MQMHIAFYRGGVNSFGTRFALYKVGDRLTVQSERAARIRRAVPRGSSPKGCDTASHDCAGLGTPGGAEVCHVAPWAIQPHPLIFSPPANRAVLGSPCGFDAEETAAFWVSAPFVGRAIPFGAGLADGETALDFGGVGRGLPRKNSHSLSRAGLGEVLGESESAWEWGFFGLVASSIWPPFSVVTFSTRVVRYVGTRGTKIYSELNYGIRNI